MQAWHRNRLGIELLEARRLLSVAGQDQAMELFSTSPALFVENQGQWADESIRFLHEGDGVNVAMTDAGPVFQLFQREPAADDNCEVAGHKMFLDERRGAFRPLFHPLLLRGCTANPFMTLDDGNR